MTIGFRLKNKMNKKSAGKRSPESARKLGKWLTAEEEHVDMTSSIVSDDEDSSESFSADSHYQAQVRSLYVSARKEFGKVLEAITFYEHKLVKARKGQEHYRELAKARCEAGNNTSALLSMRYLIKYQHEENNVEHAIQFLKLRKGALARFLGKCECTVGSMELGDSSSSSLCAPLRFEAKQLFHSVKKAQEILNQAEPESRPSDEQLLTQLETVN